jgi:hypothetical protein
MLSVIGEGKVFEGMDSMRVPRGACTFSNLGKVEKEIQVEKIWGAGLLFR